jgi:hypothetical protein
MSTMRPRSLLDELDKLESLREPEKAGQRQFRRFVVRGEAELHPMNRNRLDPTPLTIQLRDISRGGLGFLCDQPLEAYSAWRVCFLNEGYVVGEQALVVRHCRPVNDELYLVGGQFVIDAGLMISLGVAPGALEDDQTEQHEQTSDDGDFLTPGELG